MNQAVVYAIVTMVHPNYTKGVNKKTRADRLIYTILRGEFDFSLAGVFSMLDRFKK